MSQPILYIHVDDAGATNLQLEIRTKRDEFKKKKIQYHRYTSIGNQSVPVVAPSSLKTTYFPQQRNVFLDLSIPKDTGTVR